MRYLLLLACLLGLAWSPWTPVPSLSRPTAGWGVRDDKVTFVFDWAGERETAYASVTDRYKTGLTFTGGGDQPTYCIGGAGYIPWNPLGYYNGVNSTAFSPRTNNFTIMWMFRTSYNYTSDFGVFWWDNGWGDQYGWQEPTVWLLMDTSERVQAYFEDRQGNTIAVVTPTGQNDNKWHHACVTRVGSVFTMYLDGELTQTSTNAAMGDIYIEVNAGATIGYYHPYNCLKGAYVDDFVWYTGLALTPDEVRLASETHKAHRQ